MSPVLGERRWRRWSVTGLGALLCGVIVVTAAVTQHTWTTLEYLQLGIPVALAIGLVAYGGWLVTTDASGDRVRRIALWALAGSLLLGAFSTWEMYTHVVDGESLGGTVHEVLLGLTEGAAVGGVVGYYDARRADEHVEAERARQAIATSRDGIAILDEEGEYEMVNRAHAEIYGYDDPDWFVGRPWTVCYAEEEASRLEEELMPRLQEEGSWRGELTGRRADGSTFPQEITLSVRPDGGIVCIVRDITERKRHQHRLEALHGVTREFLTADSPDGVVAELVTASADMLDHPLTAVWRYDADADRLVPQAATDAAEQFAMQSAGETLPAIEADAAEMEIFRTNETVMVEDYQTLEGRQASDVPLGAVLFVPLGEYGLVAIGGGESDAIDETDRFLGEVLVSNARAAIDRLQRERELATREQRLRTIVENVPVILFAVDPDRKITLQVGQGLEAVDVGQDEMVGATVDELFEGVDPVLDAIDRAYDGEAVSITTDLWGRTYRVWYQPIEAGGAVTDVIGVAMDVTDAHRRERGIRALHDATREMMQATDREAICRIAVETCQASLDLPISTIWLRADDQPRLEPAAWTDRAEGLFGAPPVFEPGESLSWQAFEDGELRVYEDVREESARFNPETAVRSELIVPLGEFGVLNSGRTEAGEFDDTDIVLARLLAANTRTALERADREDALQRQTDQMEFFNSILRHDVLNGMTVIRGRAEFLAEDLEGQQRQDAQTIVDWADDITTIIRRVRRVLETLTGTGDPQLEPVDLSAVLRAEVDRVRATYPSVAFETTIPDEVTVRANELLGEVLGNVITNAVDHNDADGLCVTVTADVDRSDPTAPVTVRIADDGRGVPEDLREEIFRRDSTGHAKSTGSGFGLFFVDSMVGEYGGDVRVEENETGGATFVIELPRPQA